MRKREGKGGKKYTKGSEANRGERITGVIAANAERVGRGVSVTGIGIGVYIAPAIIRRVHAYLFSARTLAWPDELSSVHSVTSVFENKTENWILLFE